MTDIKAIEYKKAYVELLEILKILPKEIFDKIPSEVIENMEKMKSSDYSWAYDASKDIENQDLMIETKALFVQLYKNYFMEQSEKEKWDKYDKITQKIIEEEKAKLYDPSKIFQNKNIEKSSSNITIEVEQNEEPIESQGTSLIIKEENVFQKISKMFKEFINKILKKDK